MLMSYCQGAAIALSEEMPAALTVWGVLKHPDLGRPTSSR